MSTYPSIYYKLLPFIHYFVWCLLMDLALPVTQVFLIPRFQLLFPLIHSVGWCQRKLQSCCSNLSGASSHLWEKSRFLSVSSKAPHCLLFLLPSSLMFIYSLTLSVIFCSPQTAGLLKHCDLCTFRVFCLKAPLASSS